MTYEEIATIIAGVGIPYSYYQFPEDTGQQPPFICFYYPDRNDLLADDSNYQKIVSLTIELYTDQKDFDLEETLEAVLAEHGLVYSFDETFIDSEQMHLSTYYTDVVITATTEGELNG